MNKWSPVTASDLRTSIVRDRNSKTPYYSNPYGYSSNTRSNVNNCSVDSRKQNYNRMSSSNAFNKDTRSLISPFIEDSPSKVKVSLNQKMINPKFISKVTSKNNSVWNQHERIKIQRLKSEGRRKAHQSPIISDKHSQSIDLETMGSPAMNSSFT